MEEAKSSNADPAMLCESVGYLIRKDKIGVTVALSKSRNGKHVCDTMLIPRTAVESIKVLTAKGR